MRCSECPYLEVVGGEGEEFFPWETFVTDEECFVWMILLIEGCFE